MGVGENETKSDTAWLFRPLSPDTIANPFPVFQRLQRETPVFWHDGLYAWVLSRYHDCRMVLHHPDRFARDRKKLGRPVSEDEITIQSLDPPDQNALRQSVFHCLKHTDTPAACRDAIDMFERCLEGQLEGRPFDFMRSVAAPAAMRFASSLVGVHDMSPEAYLSTFLRLTRAMDRDAYSHHRDAGVVATLELNRVIDAAVATAPARSMIHELYSLPGVREMHPPYVRNTISAAFNAAFSTAYSSMGSFLALCLETGDLANRIVSTGQVSLGTSELLRFTSPAQSTARFATCDTEIAGAKVRQNDPIVTLLAAANRDPEAFEFPNELLLDRSPNPHLSFGYGPHRCVGAKPAEEFLAHVVVRLADWESRLILAGSPSWLDTATLRCLNTLPVSRIGSPRR